LALAAGNATIWKPSLTTPLCSIAMTSLISSVLEKNGVPGAVAGLLTGGKDVGSTLAESRLIDLGELFQADGQALADWNYVVSFTGSEMVGRSVGQTVTSRFGKTILELGGNNGTIRLLHT
jgi:aldehyde dehydrogenase family 7 member A1